MAAIEGSSERGEVLDLQLQGTCADTSDTGVPTIAANVTVGGACWEHSHPHQLNVLDFSSWPSNHPGGDAPINKFAQDGEVALHFPHWHTMGYWQDNQGRFTYLGRLGDTIDFRHLDSTLQLAAYAELVGAEPVYSEAFEACGSPGEVANAPAEANRYNIILTNDDTRPSDGYPVDVPTIIPEEAGVGVDQVGKVHSLNFKRTGGGAGTLGAQGTHSMHQGKNIAWTMVALHAEDQLRQRVAWALYQIFVISDADGMKDKEAEAWHSYYDIVCATCHDASNPCFCQMMLASRVQTSRHVCGQFVRHAFGSYRDVLREVSYSPMMASYLTFLKNKAIAFGSYPDENYAREVMQLFSVGLHRLNSDGTPLRIYYMHIWVHRV